MFNISLTLFEGKSYSMYFFHKIYVNLCHQKSTGDSTIQKTAQKTNTLNYPQQRLYYLLS